MHVRVAQLLVEHVDMRENPLEVRDQGRPASCSFCRQHRPLCPGPPDASNGRRALKGVIPSARKATWADAAAVAVAASLEIYGFSS